MSFRILQLFLVIHSSLFSKVFQKHWLDPRHLDQEGSQSGNVKNVLRAAKKDGSDYLWCEPQRSGLFGLMPTLLCLSGRLSDQETWIQVDSRSPQILYVIVSVNVDGNRSPDAGALGF